VKGSVIFLTIVASIVIIDVIMGIWFAIAVWRHNRREQNLHHRERGVRPMPSPTYTYRGTTFLDRKGADCKLIRITDNSAMIRFDDGAVKIVPKYCIRRKKDEPQAVAPGGKTE